MNIQLSQDELDYLAQQIAGRVVEEVVARLEAANRKPGDVRLLYPEKKAAEMLNISPWTLRQWRLNGKIVASTSKRPIMYSYEAIEAVRDWMGKRGM